jgi:hypothetical protein
LTAHAPAIQNAAIPIVIASRPLVARYVVRGIILLVPALLFGYLAIMALILLTEPPTNRERQFAMPRLAITLPVFLVTALYASRNFQRLAVSAGITANDEGLSLRIPVVPFVMAPYYAVRETFVPWSEVDRRFTPGKESRYFVASTRPESEVPSGTFDRSNYAIDAAIAEQMQRSDPPQKVLTGSSPAMLLTVGAMVLAVSGGGMVWLFDTAPVLAQLMALPWIFGLALIAMGASPAKRVIIERRGIFLERGAKLDFVPSTAYDSLRVEFEGMQNGAFKSGKVIATVDGKAVTIGFNQVFGFGFPVDDIRAAFAG